jgi:hypothetical protein
VLAKAAAAEELFDLFLKDKGDLARASAGSKRFSPGGKKEKREERREPQAPTREARWTKKHERSYLNHIGVGLWRKFMRRYGARGCEPTI